MAELWMYPRKLPKSFGASFFPTTKANPKRPWSKQATHLMHLFPLSQDAGTHLEPSKHPSTAGPRPKFAKH